MVRLAQTLFERKLQNERSLNKKREDKSMLSASSEVMKSLGPDHDEGLSQINYIHNKSSKHWLFTSFEGLCKRPLVILLNSKTVRLVFALTTHYNNKNKVLSH